MQKVKPEISIIVPVLNEKNELIFFDNLKNSINNDVIIVKIIVIDGCSKDNTVKYIKNIQ